MEQQDTRRLSCPCAARPRHPLAALIFDMHMGHVTAADAKRRMDAIVPPVETLERAA